MTEPLPDLGDRSPLVVQSRFPSRLTTLAGTVVSPRCLVVLTVDPDVGPELWCWERIDAEPRLHERWSPDGSVIPRGGEGRWTVATESGVYVVSGGGGCPGCSSRLGRWKPFHPWRFTRMPDEVDRSAEG